jgi:hypothetical protein
MFMRKITSDSDYEIVNSTLANINPHSTGAYMQFSVPGHLIDTDYDLYLAVEWFLFNHNLIEKFGNSGRVIITPSGEGVIENYQGDVRKYLKGATNSDARDNFYLPELGYYTKTEPKKKKKIWKKISAIIGLIAAIITILYWLFDIPGFLRQIFDFFKNLINP